MRRRVWPKPPRLSRPVNVIRANIPEGRGQSPNPAKSSVEKATSFARKMQKGIAGNQLSPFFRFGRLVSYLVSGFFSVVAPFFSAAAALAFVAALTELATIFPSFSV